MELPKVELPKIMLAGAGEKAQYLVHDFNDNTIRFLLHYPTVIDADILSKATKAVVSSLRILHSSFVVGKLSAHWHINDEYDESDYFSHIQAEDNLTNYAKKAALKPIKPEGKVQLHCTLVHSQTESIMVLTISHLCVDGSDGKYLLGKLIEAYNLILTKGNAEELTLKHGSRMAEQIYKELSPKEYFSLMKNPFSPIKSVFPFPTQDPGTPHMTTAIISADVMSAARTRGKIVGSTVNDILLTACYHAYAALDTMDAHTPMSIMSMMDLRQHCKNGESEGLCNMSGSLPTTLENGICEDFSKTLEIITEQTKSAKNNPLAGMEGMPLLHGVTHTFPMGLLLQVAEKVYGSMAMGFTNLGIIPCDTLNLGDSIPDSGYAAGPMKKKSAFQIATGSFNGTAALSVIGEYTDEDEIVIQNMLDHIVSIITEYAKEN